MLFVVYKLTLLEFINVVTYLEVYVCLGLPYVLLFLEMSCC